jgi:hypothetical protein
LFTVLGAITPITVDKAGVAAEYGANARSYPQV